MNALFKYIINFILEQIKPSICQVKYKNNISIGCLCKIPLQTGVNYMPVLLTSLELFGNKKSIKNETIEIYNKNNNTNIYTNIKIDNSRISYSSKEYNIVFIEIIENDHLDSNLFLSLNSEVLKKHEVLYNISVSFSQDEFEIYLSKTFGNIIKQYKNKNSNNLIVLSDNQIFDFTNFIYNVNDIKRQSIGTFFQSTLENFSKKISELKLNEIMKNINLTKNQSLNSSESYLSGYFEKFGIKFQNKNKSESEYLSSIKQNDNSSEISNNSRWSYLIYIYKSNNKYNSENSNFSDDLFDSNKNQKILKMIEQDRSNLTYEKESNRLDEELDKKSNKTEIRTKETKYIKVMVINRNISFKVKKGKK